MNLLFLSQGYTVADQQGYHEAVLAAQTDGLISEYHNIPFLGHARANGWDGLWREVITRCRQVAFDLVFFQYFHGEIQSAGACLSQLKSLLHPPVIAASCGDSHTGKFYARPPQRAFVELAAVSDVTFLTSMGSFAAYLASRGAKRLMFMPHAFSEVVFHYPTDEILGAVREFDVVFVGSSSHSRNPLRWWVKRHEARRQKIVKQLYRRYGRRFGLFGYGWQGCPAWQGPIPFKEQQAAFWRGNLVVDARAPFDEMYYASDRPFYIAGSGIPLVQHFTPRFDSIFAPERNAYYVHNDTEVTKVCDRVLDMDAATRLQHARETLDLVRDRHLFRHRVRDMLLTCAMVGEAKTNNRFDGLADRVPMGHFLPEVDRAGERPYALVNW